MLHGKPFFKGKKVCEGLRVSVDGVERINSVIEYCISEGWVRVLACDKAGAPILNADKTELTYLWIKGEVKVWRDK